MFDPRLVAHALENIQHRLQRGVANPSAQFVTTTRAGHLAGPESMVLGIK